MAGNSKTEDDEDGFGDFTFASVPRANPKSNVSDLFSKKTNDADNDNDDDDWGDFVKSTSLSRSESLPVKQADPFSFFSNHWNDKSGNDDSVPESAPSRMQSPWTKPTGAIPLSIFGEEEEEKEKEEEGLGAAGLLFNGAAERKVEKFDVKKGNKGSELNVSNLISNLYQKKEQNNYVNESKPDSNGWVINLERLSFSSSGLGLDSNGLDLKKTGSNPDSNGLNSVWEEDDEWEFKGAESKLSAGDFISKSDQQVLAEDRPKSKFNDGDISSWGVMGSDLKGLNSNLNGVNLDVNPSGSSILDQSADIGDDDGWEFKDAGSGTQSGYGNSKVNGNGPGISGVKQTSGFGHSAPFQTDLFAASDNTSQKSGEWDFSLDFIKSSASPNGVISNLYSNSKQKDDIDIGSSSTPVSGYVDGGENSWGFKDAFSDTGSEDKRNEVIDNHKVPFPLSLFGEEEPKTDDTLTNEDVPSNPTSTTSDGIKKSHVTNVSINDLISSLYGQTEQTVFVNHAEGLSENGLGSGQQYVASNLVDADDGFDDDSWEFKGAVTGTEDQDQTLVPDRVNSHTKCSIEMEMNDFVEFFSKLKDELSSIAQCHLENLKKARSAAAVAGEDAKVHALDKEIQEVDDELCHDSLLSVEVIPDKLLPSKICLNGFVKTLQEPKFHVLESEYQLSKKLLLAEKDWRSAIKLLKHAASISKILTMGSREEQSNYVSTWYRMVSVCTQELRHAAFIWEQSLEKNVHDQILSDPRGKQFLCSIGEIYRVVEVFRCSAKLYKPWVLLCSADSQGMFTLLSECSTLWSSSGFEEALQRISGPIGFANNGTSGELLESIRFIHNLDTLALHDRVFPLQEPTCRLSALTALSVPGLKMVVWNEEHYFLPLANLWANLISSEPPSLPCIHVG